VTLGSNSSIRGARESSVNRAARCSERHETPADYPVVFGRIRCAATGTDQGRPQQHWAGNGPWIRASQRLDAQWPTITFHDRVARQVSPWITFAAEQAAKSICAHSSPSESGLGWRLPTCVYSVGAGREYDWIFWP
jgi:hypothetical protein